MPVARRVRAALDVDVASGSGSGTRSDSSAYCERNASTSASSRETTSNGIPIGPPSHLPEPKSAWTGASSPIALTIAAEFCATGSVSTACSTGCRGKTRQRRAEGSRSACADDRRQQRDRETGNDAPTAS